MKEVQSSHFLELNRLFLLQSRRIDGLLEVAPFFILVAEMARVKSDPLIYCFWANRHNVMVVSPDPRGPRKDFRRCLLAQVNSKERMEGSEEGEK